MLHEALFWHWQVNQANVTKAMLNILRNNWNKELFTKRVNAKKEAHTAYSFSNKDIPIDCFSLKEM